MTDTPTTDAIDDLRERFGDRVITVRSERINHANTLGLVGAQPADAVICPRDTAEVQAIVRICARRHTPVIPVGAGTSHEGQINAPRGGIAVSTREMTAILAVNDADLDCVVQPGVTRNALNEHLRDTGLFFSVDPGSDASIGGMASTRASGTNTVRYGTMRDNIVSLKAVLANGEEVSAGRRVRKSATGYDLARLLIGAEGTLGIITEITLRLHGRPQFISAGRCTMPTVEAACRATTDIMQLGLPIARIELLDAVMIHACNAFLKLDLPVAPTLFVEFHGTPAGVEEQMKDFASIVAENGGSDLHLARTQEERAQLWHARHNGYWAACALRPGAVMLGTDSCVPISRLAECVEATRIDLEKSGITGVITGHVGDGNFHAGLVIDRSDTHEVARADAFVERLAVRTLDMGGTVSGEHGVGQKKIRFMEAEHGGAALDVFRSIKRALDPLDIMNPEKMFERPAVSEQTT